MPLPPPSHNPRWKDYEIDTPTFQLTPIEKPDMSPFLVHMTGRNEIVSILTGENAPVSNPPSQGYLKAGIPEHAKRIYKAAVVCFTESPTFALDFFRYRSFHRWDKDQRYGIGFDKEDLAERGVRPVVYADKELLANIIFLHQTGKGNNNQFSSNENLNSKIVSMLQNIYPLLFPLLENEQLQGYMWEREWRHPNPDGFTFNLSDIKIICCPEEEEQNIRDILGNTATQVDFIRAWREYDDVTDYLQKQSQIWQSQSEKIEQAKPTDETIGRLRNLVQQYTVALHSLEAYADVINRFSSEASRIQQEKAKILQEFTGLKEQLDTLERERKRQAQLKQTKKQ